MAAVRTWFPQNTGAYTGTSDRVSSTVTSTAASSTADRVLLGRKLEAVVNPRVERNVCCFMSAGTIYF